jgi:hypothetical protein
MNVGKPATLARWAGLISRCALGAEANRQAGSEVEFATAGMDQKLFVSRTLVALPSVEKLRRFLEADRERLESMMPSPSARKRAVRKPKN